MSKKEKYLSSFSLKLYNICQRWPYIRKFKVLLYFLDSLLLCFIKKPKKFSNQKRKEVLIIYNYSFGDGIIFLCSFKNIREIYPKKYYKITIICQKGLQSIYENTNLFDEIVPYDLTGSTFNIKIRFNLFKLLRSKYYSILIDPIGVNECTTNVFMSMATCADEKITIIDQTIKNKMCPKWIYKKIYTKIFEVTKENQSLISYYNEIIKGLNNKKSRITFENGSLKKISIKLPQAYYIVFPSASTVLKNWPIDRYLEIIKRVYNETKLPVLFCGTKSDIKNIQELKKMLIDVPYYDIVGKTNLLDFIEVIKRSKFVITNDTSTYHIAVTNQIPVAIITGGYTYDRYVTYNFEGSKNYRRPYIIVKRMECFNCDNNCKKLRRNSNTWPCLDAITVDDAWKIIKEMINKET